MTAENLRPIKIAINALGGQGGGVLAGWIVKVAERSGYIAQYTSVPGVAQRTGATIYYLELFPQAVIDQHGKEPVLALSPVPGDVDIVIAAEVMEAGRAMMRGFVSPATTLIASSHRVYAISEKIKLGDGRQSPEEIIDAAKKASKHFVFADMDAMARGTASVISAVLFGALAGSGALPFTRSAYMETIRRSGRAVDENLAGFAKGFEAGGEAAAPLTSKGPVLFDEAPALVNADNELVDRIRDTFPAAAHFMLTEGVKKLIDYQGKRYASLYLDRMQHILDADRQHSGERRGWRLTKETARSLALWMAFEDTIRVANLKTRKSRFDRVRGDVKAAPEQIVHVKEYLHPRVEEICDLMPAPIGRLVLSTPPLRKTVSALFGHGRRISTTKLRGFLLLNFIGSLKPIRRMSLRYKVEDTRINDWLQRLLDEAAADYKLAGEIAAMQRLIKGYGETHERGLASFSKIMEQVPAVKQTSDPAAALRKLVDAALTDDEGRALSAAIEELQSSRLANQTQVA